MDKCPKCGKYTVSYDGYHRTNRCYEDECSVRIASDNASYTYIRRNYEKKVIEKVEVTIATGEEKVVYEYEMF